MTVRIISLTVIVTVILCFSCESPFEPKYYTLTVRNYTGSALEYTLDDEWTVVIENNASSRFEHVEEGQHTFKARWATGRSSGSLYISEDTLETFY